MIKDVGIHMNCTKDKNRKKEKEKKKTMRILSVLTPRILPITPPRILRTVTNNKVVAQGPEIICQIL